MLSVIAQLQLNQGLGPMQGLPPLPGMQGLPGLPGQFPPPMPGLNPHQLMSMGISPMAASQMAANLAAIRLPPGAQQAGCVILVSNLDEEVSDCIHLVIAVAAVCYS